MLCHSDDTLRQLKLRNGADFVSWQPLGIACMQKMFSQTFCSTHSPRNPPRARTNARSTLWCLPRPGPRPAPRRRSFSRCIHSTTLKVSISSSCSCCLPAWAGRGTSLSCCTTAATMRRCSRQHRWNFEDALVPCLLFLSLFSIFVPVRFTIIVYTITINII